MVLPGGLMDRAATEIAIKTFLVEIRARLEDAARTARAAQACAYAANVDTREGGTRYRAADLRSWPSPGRDQPSKPAVTSRRRGVSERAVDGDSA